MTAFRNIVTLFFVIFCFHIILFNLWIVDEARGYSNENPNIVFPNIDDSDADNLNNAPSETGNTEGNFAVDVNAPVETDSVDTESDTSDTATSNENQSLEADPSNPASEISTTMKNEQGPKSTEEEVEKNIMEVILALLDNSQEEWAKGDLESALSLLDQAYALILDTNGSPDIARQKDDLRLLISKRILAIYSSRQAAANGKRGEIPLIINEDVENAIKSFQTREKDFFVKAYSRSSIYRPIISQELLKAGLPEELSWLPLVESGFKASALSRARALGPWQFIPSTGYKYNLNRNEWIDERMDLEKSTKAAIAYLKELHNMFGDWLTVLAAYNCGEGRVLKVISRQHLNYFDRFWDLYHQLPYETARYVPRFLATLHIIKNPQKYDMELSFDPSQTFSYEYETVTTTKSMKLKDIAKYIETSEEVLSTLNAELRYQATPDKDYNLKVPINMAEKFATVVDKIPVWKAPAKSRTVVIRHKIKKGETLSSIAHKYRSSIKAISSYNRIYNYKTLRVGRQIYVPVRGYRNINALSGQQRARSEHGGCIHYKVRKGDTLSTIAKRFGTSISNIRTENKLKGSTIRYGDILKINSLN